MEKYAQKVGGKKATIWAIAT